MKSTNVLIAAAAWTITVTSCIADCQWSNVGPDGGNVTRLAADPHNSAIIYAATCAGVYKTLNGGESWTSTAPGPPAECLTVLAVDPQYSETVYAGWCLGFLFKTIDGGASWNRLTSLPSSDCLQSLSIDPGNSSTLYVSDNGGVLKSLDGGMTWARISGHEILRLLAIDPQGTLYAAGYSGLIKSVDSGVTWNPANVGLPQSPFGAPLYIQALAIDSLGPETLYAGGGGRIFKSTNRGASWTELSTGLAQGPGIGYDLLSLATNPQNPGTIYFAVVRHVAYNPSEPFLLTSMDGGATWILGDDPMLSQADLNSLMPSLQDQATVYLATADGVLKSTDGGFHWKSMNAGLKANWIVHLFIDPRDRTFVAINGPQPPTQAASKRPAVFKSLDQGKTWAPAGFGTLFYGGIIANPQDAHVLYSTGTDFDRSGRATGSGLFKSEDAGDTWSEIWRAPGSQGLGPIVIAPQNPNALYAGRGTCNGYDCSLNTAKSLDGGFTWTDSPTPFKRSEWIWSLAIDPQNQDILYVGTGDDNGTGSGLGKARTPA